MLKKPSYPSKYNTNRSFQPAIRKNERIRASEVRVIGPSGAQLGVMPTREAMRLASQHGLDLVEVAANATPPVCRILDFGKYVYEEGKKSKAHKSTATKVKELKFRIGIDQHDYMTKVRHAEAFLFKGNKVKLTVMLRGRDMERKGFGIEVLERAIVDLAHMATADNRPTVNGRNILLSLTPLPTAKRKLKFNQEDVSDEDLVDDSEVED